MVDTKRHQDHNGCCPIPYKHFEAVIILEAVNSEGDFNVCRTTLLKYMKLNV
jgi:hypothetical protein